MSVVSSGKNNKSSLRLQVIKECTEIIQDKHMCFTLSCRLLQQLLPFLNQANKIVIYHAIGHEISLQPVIDYCLAQAKELYQPLAHRYSKHMGLIPYSAHASAIFSDGNYGVTTDADISSSCKEWSNMDLILLPLVAVDKLGNRLGRGAGYYDYALQFVNDTHHILRRHAVKPVLCGVGFDCQYLDNIHILKDSWDVSLDYFISPTRALKLYH